MAVFTAILLLASLSSSSHRASAKCLSIEQTITKVGERVCVTGKVFKVERGPSGVHVLNFCEETSAPCPFRVVVYPNDLRDVGDVRWMEGKSIEIHSAIRDRDGRAEMKLNDARQIKGEAAKLPLIPKQYDVESRGKFSPGTSQAPKHKTPRRSRRKGDVKPQPAPDESGVPPPP